MAIIKNSAIRGYLVPYFTLEKTAVGYWPARAALE